jgi:hypothetical protein
MKRIISILALTIVSACALPVAQYVPAVSQYNGDSVTIQVNSSASGLNEADKVILKANMQSKAEEICRRGHAKRAEYTSQTFRSTGQYSGVLERLYLCLK